MHQNWILMLLALESGLASWNLIVPQNTDFEASKPGLLRHKLWNEVLRARCAPKSDFDAIDSRIRTCILKPCCASKHWFWCSKTRSFKAQAPKWVSKRMMFIKIEFWCYKLRNRDLLLETLFCLQTLILMFQNQGFWGTSSANEFLRARCVSNYHFDAIGFEIMICVLQPCASKCQFWCFETRAFEAQAPKQGSKRTMCIKIQFWCYQYGKCDLHLQTLLCLQTLILMFQNQSFQGIRSKKRF